MSPPQLESSPQSAWPQWVLVAVVVLTFGRLVPYDFLLWDDPFHLTANRMMNPVTSDTLKYYWTHSDLTMYNPVTYTTWMGLTFAARVDTPDPKGVTLNPMVFRAFNVLVHTGSTLLVFAILKQLTRHRVAALFGALIYAVHPVQVESVGWISGLKDLLWGFFSFAAIYLYLRFAAESTTGGRRWFYVGGMLMLILAMLSKPTAMVTPALVIAIDWLLLKRPWKQIALSAGPWLALSIPCMIIARTIQTGVRTYAGPLWARPLIVLDSLAFYAGKLVWPVSLAPDYGHRPATVLASGNLWWTWIIPVVLIALALWQWRRRSWIAAGLALFAIGTMPTLGWIPFAFQYYSTTADHYLYVSMLGVGVIVAYFVATTRWPLRNVVILLAGVTVLLTGRSIVQARIWADSRSLFNHTLTVTPQSIAALLQTATLDLAANEPTLAEQRLRQVLMTAPDLTKAYNILAQALLMQGRDDEAIPYLKKYIELHINNPRGMRSSYAPQAMVIAQYYLDRNDTAQARLYVEKALSESPGDPQATRLLVKVLAAGSTQPATRP